MLAPTDSKISLTDTCKSTFGPIITHLISTWKLTESHANINMRYHTHLPLFNNPAICIGGRPISFPQWNHKGIHILSDIVSQNILQSFQELSSLYNLPGTSFFFYLQLRCALRGYEVPWGEKLKTIIPSIKYVLVKQPKAWYQFYKHS